MGSICYLIGIILAGYAGYNGFQWYFIFISALIMAIGYSIIRAPQMHGAASRDGAIAIPKLLFCLIILFSIITAAIYFVASFFN